MLSIPGSSCECERLFSELGDLLEPRRRSISPQLLAAIQCDRRWIRARFGSGEVPVKEAISDEEMDAKYANPSEPSELLASAQLAEQANWLSSLSLLIDICGRATQRFADGIGILGYDDINAVVSALPLIDRMRFQYSWANDREQRCLLGSMPSTTQIRDIVETARQYDHGSGVSEDEWNSEVQHPLLKLARNTSKHRQPLDIHNV
ncbi:Dimer-Tnp-hAT dimerization containing protein [Pyrenophora tritici-repentis]|nr:Dimer-Tnp-hAT dimerization containing protein [Pyrenophora tritici-repentis]